MASSSLASLLCTWLVAACMSVTSRNDQSLLSGSASSNTRLGHWARIRKKALLSKCCSGGTATNKDANLISSFRGSMAYYLAFEPCNEYYSSKKGIFFDQNGKFSYFFCSRNVPFNNIRKQRRLNREVPRSGNL
ncbi:ARABIDOPSIS BETA-KETOACYL-ACP SYNTHETASE 2, BETA-KETOACYL-ACP SYNTHETASE 2 [Hibiscus trionum]|uniref:ARABIDOPSIS BETA-KETOACYL-ACP SYNTHETASE 2, BETA-KETOACYL-ACP SYNTHETASE 2 n=1 Tax=Hibiscus trionum TaxID=183268 RepID=A0A9W7MKS7_HIBTR|nr:ARABIDOPSIS BETA-KETOACYL-ACP SYNTHETASE 2, BETA-KETOACYL-ACP SYNTHETASE 2 [Hibiscus trionum]